MKVGRIILLVMGIMMLATSATAGDEKPDYLEISSPWAVANGVDTVNIQVIVMNTTLGPVQGASVTVTCLNATMGRTSTTTYYTNAMGYAYPTFTANRTSGIAPLVISVSKTTTDGTYSLSQNHSQKIDHSTPYRYAYILYNKTEYVNNLTTITVRMVDQYGNPIDSRREADAGEEAEKVQFVVSSPEDGAYFQNGETQIAQEVNVEGNAVVQMRVSPYVGENIVMVAPMVPSIPSTWLTITGLGSDPKTITSTIVPGGNPPSLPADGTSEFTIIYTVLDQWGNPSVGRQIDVTTEFINSMTNSSERWTLTATNLLGQSSLKYGRKPSAVDVNITARIIGFDQVNRTDTVRFINGTATRLTLTASPNPIPSWDVPGNVTADIIAKVMDDFNNPVPGENVTFWIESVSYEGSSAQAVVNAPVLLSSSAYTNEYGYATVQFQPGEFIVNISDPNWVEKATGTAVVKAKGDNTMVESVNTVWKNYPYLNVDVQVNPLPVNPGDEFDITFTLQGDGWALRPKPIDTVLSMARGLTMLKDDDDRILHTRPAAKVFNSQMVPNYDRVGLWTFGDVGWADLLNNPAIKNAKYVGDDNNKNDDAAMVAMHYPGNSKTYDDYATRDHVLTGDISAVDTEVDLIVPFSEQTDVAKGQPIRYGIYHSIKDLIENGRPNAVKAVIVLVDMDWDWFGDPLASGNIKYYPADNPEQMVSGSNFMAFPLGGPYTGNWSTTSYDTRTSWQNMSNYARDNNIKLFTVTYSSDVSSSAKTTLRILAEGAGGFHRHAATEAQLIDVYNEIAGVLKTEAGVNTTMEISMNNLEVNNVTMSGDDVFTYVYSPGTNNPVTRDGNSTKMWFYNTTGTLSYNDTIDQREEWNTTHRLDFALGTIHLSETWEVQYRLRVNSSVCGDVQIFDNSSRLVFNDGAESITIPQFSIQVPCNLTSIVNISTLGVDITSIAKEHESLVTNWDLTYIGTEDLEQTVSYQYQDQGTGVWGDWVVFDTTSANNTTAGGTARLFAQDLPYGIYRINVFAREDSIGGAIATDTEEVSLTAASTKYIKLE